MEVVARARDLVREEDMEVALDKEVTASKDLA